jgi:hypothetical protein
VRTRENPDIELMVKVEATDATGFDESKLRRYPKAPRR